MDIYVTNHATGETLSRMEDIGPEKAPQAIRSSLNIAKELAIDDLPHMAESIQSDFEALVEDLSDWPHIDSYMGLGDYTVELAR